MITDPLEEVEQSEDVDVRELPADRSDLLRQLHALRRYRLAVKPHLHLAQYAGAKVLELFGEFIQHRALEPAHHEGRDQPAQLRGCRRADSSGPFSKYRAANSSSRPR